MSDFFVILYLGVVGHFSCLLARVNLDHLRQAVPALFPVKGYSNRYLVLRMLRADNELSLSIPWDLKDLSDGSFLLPRLLKSSDTQASHTQ